MTEANPNQLHGSLRCLFVVLGLTLLSLLATARYLRPDPTGQGTHQQLGLPPCTFVVLYDMPCPSCGMTTSWAHAMRGQIPSALRANVGGTLLAAAALVIGPWLLASGLLGRKISRHPSDGKIALAAVTLMVVTIIDWMNRLSELN